MYAKQKMNIVKVGWVTYQMLQDRRIFLDLFTQPHNIFIYLYKIDIYF